MKRYRVTIETDSLSLTQFLSLQLAREFPQEPEVTMRDRKTMEIFYAHEGGAWISAGHVKEAEL